MSLRVSLKQEIKHLQNEGKKLQQKRKLLTKQIDEEIKENEEQQQIVQTFFNQMFPATKKPSGDSRTPRVSKGKRTRKDRSALPAAVLNVIQNAQGGIRRRAIINELGMENDKPGHQYVSNILRDMKQDGRIRAEQRLYFIGRPSSPVQEPTPSQASPEIQANPEQSEQPKPESDQGQPSQPSFGWQRRDP